MNAIFQGDTGQPEICIKQLLRSDTVLSAEKAQIWQCADGVTENTSEWQFAGTDLNQAVDMAKNNKLTSSAQASYLYHGKLTGIWILSFRSLQAMIF
ncbi:hypothetical protein GUK16_26935 (plasmid) [Escherichia coli]|uniref:hypothetical protein n=1 Tax=Escherichia coli TaxID=562 RepID=UPI001DC60665|nr:hypothetical protein [Escherichia coli]MBF8913061.1 hypothetical protein [Escherichia coli]